MNRFQFLTFKASDSEKLMFSKTNDELNAIHGDGLAMRSKGANACGPTIARGEAAKAELDRRGRMLGQGVAILAVIISIGALIVSIIKP